MGDYALTVTLQTTYEAAVERVTAALAEQGFGLLTEIDAQATLKAKLGIDTRPYVILGACNPPLAHRAMQAEPGVGLLLPCNVIVYTGDAPGEIVVSLVDPMMMVQVIDNPVLVEVAREARSRLEKVAAALH